MDDKEKIIIEDGREKDHLTDMGRKVYELTKRLITEDGGDLACLFMVTDGKGGSDFLMGSTVELAKETIQVCARQEDFRQWLFAFMRELNGRRSNQN